MALQALHRPVLSASLAVCFGPSPTKSSVSWRLRTRIQRNECRNVGSSIEFRVEKNISSI